MSSDEELIRRIRASLHQAVVGVEPPPNLLATLRVELLSGARQGWLRRPSVLGLGQRLRAGVAVLPMTLAIGVVIAIVVVALTLPGHGHPSLPGGPPNSGGPPSIPPPNDPALKYLRSLSVTNPRDPGCSRRAVSPARTIRSRAVPAELLSLFSVLRRPKEPGDALPRFVANRGDFPTGANVVFVNYIRLARIESGARYYLIPAITIADPGGFSARCAREWQSALRRELPHIPAALRARAQKVLDELIALRRYDSEPHQSVCFFAVAPGGGSGGLSCASAAQIKQRGMMQSSQAPRRRAPDVFSGVVPDGVASITLEFKQASHRPATFNVRPLDNVFVVIKPPGTPHGFPVKTVWRNTRGQIIKVIASPAG